MKKLLALVLAMACALSLGIPTLAKTADVTWSQVNVEDFVDEDGDKIADDDVIRPGQTIYWVFGKYSDYDYLLDDKMVKIDVDKDEGSKNIDGKPKVVGKKLGNLGRCVALEIVIKDTYTADELKTKLDIYITAKKDLKATNAGTGDFPIYVEGTLSNTDIDAAVARLDTQIEGYIGSNKDINNINGGSVKTAEEKKVTINEYKTFVAAWENGKITPSGGAEMSYPAFKTAMEAAKDAKDGAENAFITATGKSNLSDAENAYNTANTNHTANEELVDGENNAPATIALALNNTAATNSYTQDGSTYTVTYTVTNLEIGTWGFEATKNGVDGTGPDSISGTLGEGNAAATALKSAVEALSITGLGSRTVSAYLSALETAKEQENILTAVGTKYTDYENAKTEYEKYTAINLTAYTAAKNNYEGIPNSDRKTVAQYEAELKALDDQIKADKASAQKLLDEKAKLQGTNTTTVSINNLPKGKTMKVPMTIWIQNENRVDDDATFVAGEKGVVIKPVKNEENTVTWEDNNDTLAIMKFTADSDVEYYMPRMATKWNNEDYLDYFDDMDAYIRSFVGNPSIPCTSRARLWINNPFVDDDGEETIDPDDIYVYEVVDGELYDITDKVEYTTNDDDDYAFLIKTRTLGTYIFSDGPADIEDEDDDDYDPEAPDKVEVNNNKKPVPPTGF